MTTNPPPADTPDNAVPAAEDTTAETTEDAAADLTGDATARQPTAPLTDENPTAQVPTSAGFGTPSPPPSSAWSGSSPGAAWTAGPPPGHDQPPRPTRLMRSSSDRVLTGVCGGLGRHTGVDPILFRIGFVALVFAAGTGVLLYLALAVLMPRDDGQQIWARGNGPRSRAGTLDPRVSDNEPYIPPVPRGPRSPVPGVTLAVLLIGLGVIALGEKYGNWSLDPSAYFAIAVATIGIALLVSAFGPWRRSKAGLIILGLMLSFGLFVTSAVDDRGGFGESTFSQRDYRPTSANEIQDTYQVVMGQSTLDLSGVEFTDAEPVTIDIEVTMGDFQILLPRAADVQLNGDAVFGSVSAFGNRDVIDGNYPGAGLGPQAADDDPELIIAIDVRFGNAEVNRVG